MLHTVHQQATYKCSKASIALSLFNSPIGSKLHSSLRTATRVNVIAPRRRYRRFLTLSSRSCCWTTASAISIGVASGMARATAYKSAVDKSGMEGHERSLDWMAACFVMSLHAAVRTPCRGCTDDDGCNSVTIRGCTVVTTWTTVAASSKSAAVKLGSTSSTSPTGALI